MDRKTIIIKEIETPNLVVEVDNDKYELLCEFETKEGSFQSVFVKENGADVVIESGRNSAIVGLFSTEDSVVNQLFDYIEKTISRNDGLVCWQAGLMEKLLESAEKSGNRYPLISQMLGLKDRLPLFYRQRPLDTAILAEIEAHTVDVLDDRTNPTPDYDEEMFIQGPNVEWESEPIVTPTATLPDGWRWRDFDDGSGSLKSPMGEDYYSYDILSVPGEVEFQRDKDSGWDRYPGKLADFKQYAERTISVHIIKEGGESTNMRKLDFYKIDDLNKNNFDIEYFESVSSALEAYQEALSVRGALPALGVRVQDGAMELLHGIAGESVLVTDYRRNRNFSEAMKAAEAEIREVVRWLVVEKGAAAYEYRNSLIPTWLQGSLTVLTPVTLGNEAENKYCSDKVLKATVASGLDAIDSLYIENHGWVVYNELLNHTKEYVSDGVIKVQQLNVVYVNEKNVVGMDGRMDIAPHEFSAMVEKINKPYRLVAYDAIEYLGQFKGKHDFIVASFDDAASAAEAWYEIREQNPVPLLVQTYESSKPTVVFNGRDEDDKPMSRDEAAAKFGFTNDCGLNHVLERAADRANNSAGRDAEARNADIEREI